MMKEVMPSLLKVMTPSPLQVDRCTPIEAARQMMIQHEVRHLVVTREDDIYGLVTAHELSRLADLYGHGSSDVVVDDACSSRVIAADANDPLDRILTAMWEQRLDAVVVLREGELAGIFTASDACRSFAGFLETHFGDSSPVRERPL